MNDWKPKCDQPVVTWVSLVGDIVAVTVPASGQAAWCLLQQHCLCMQSHAERRGEGGEFDDGATCFLRDFSGGIWWLPKLGWYPPVHWWLEDYLTFGMLQCYVSFRVLGRVVEKNLTLLNKVKFVIFVLEMLECTESWDVTWDIPHINGVVTHFCWANTSCRDQQASMIPGLHLSWALEDTITVGSS